MKKKLSKRERRLASEDMSPLIPTDAITFILMKDTDPKLDVKVARRFGVLKETAQTWIRMYLPQ